MNEADILDGAIEGIQRDGLYKGHYVEPKHGKSTCMIGAMNRALGVQAVLDDESGIYLEDWSSLGRDFSEIDERPVMKAKDIVQNLIKSEIGHSCIPDFNDNENTTQEDVLLILKKARATLD